MTTELNKSAVRSFLDASVGGDPAAFMASMAPDFVAHLPGGPQDREGFIQQSSAIQASFSETRFEVQEMVAEGDKIAVRATWRGIHSAEFQGLPPTGKEIVVSAFIIDRVEGGLVIEHRSLFDNMSMMQQLGALPPPGGSRE